MTGLLDGSKNRRNFRTTRVVLYDSTPTSFFSLTTKSRRFRNQLHRRISRTKVCLLPPHVSLFDSPFANRKIYVRRLYFSLHRLFLARGEAMKRFVEEGCSWGFFSGGGGYRRISHVIGNFFCMWFSRFIPTRPRVFFHPVYRSSFFLFSSTASLERGLKSSQTLRKTRGGKVVRVHLYRAMLTRSYRVIAFISLIKIGIWGAEVSAATTPTSCFGRILRL